MTFKIRRIMASLVAISAIAGVTVGSAGQAFAHVSHPVAHKKHHHKKKHRRHSRIPQHNGGDHDADNNGGPSDGDGNV